MKLKHIKQQLARINQRNEKRQALMLEQRTHPFVQHHQRTYLDCLSNNYLGLATHKKVIAAMQKAATEFGASSSASALLSGQSHYQQKLEYEFARFIGAERSVLFNSGYHANIGVINAISNRHSHIITDRLIHASILDGIKQSGAKLTRYQHQDFNDLKSILLQSTQENKLVISESVFSMVGDITPSKAISELSRLNQAILIIDDAHGLGVLGEKGQGAGSNEDLKADYVISPLGKAMGSLGALVSGRHDRIEHLVQSARSYRYSTALPAANVAASLAALKIVQAEPERVKQLQQNISLFNELSLDNQLPLLSSDPTAIRCIKIGDNDKVLAAQAHLRQNNILVGAIRPPTVPPHGGLLRITLNSDLSINHIKQLIKGLKDALK